MYDSLKVKDVDVESNVEEEKDNSFGIQHNHEYGVIVAKWEVVSRRHL